MRRPLLVVVLAACAAPPAAEDPRAAIDRARATLGTIEGVVTAGAPLPNAFLSATPHGGQNHSENAYTDDGGRYRIVAHAATYRVDIYFDGGHLVRDPVIVRERAATTLDVGVDPALVAAANARHEAEDRARTPRCPDVPGPASTVADADALVAAALAHAIIDGERLYGWLPRTGPVLLLDTAVVADQPHRMTSAAVAGLARPMVLTSRGDLEAEAIRRGGTVSFTSVELELQGTCAAVDLRLNTVSPASERLGICNVKSLYSTPAAWKYVGFLAYGCQE